jgi:uncharacterized protein (TIGR02246 family)
MNQMTTEQATKLYAQLIDAWNRRSAADFAALFSETGSTVGFDGSPLDGRAVIESTLCDIFAHHPTAAYVAKVREVRQLGSGVTILRAVVGMLPPGQTELNPAVNAIQSMVVVDEGHRWAIALLQNTPAAFHGRPQAATALTDELTAVLRSGAAVQAG